MTLYLIRGLPGSGKTTLAHKIVGKRLTCEADQFFMRNGIYQYNPLLIKEAHIWCQDKVKVLVALGVDVAVANTFTRRWEMDPYYEIARQLEDTQVVEITITTGLSNVDLANRCVHNVPWETIQKMRERWES